MNSLIQRILHVGIALLLTVSAQTARATLPLDVYAALPDVTSARVSPDGQHVAMLQPVSGAPSIVVYKMGGGHCAFAPSDVKIEGVRWANSNQLYVDVSVVRIAYFHLREHLPRRWTRSIGRRRSSSEGIASGSFPFFAGRP